MKRAIFILCLSTTLPLMAQRVAPRPAAAQNIGAMPDVLVDIPHVGVDDILLDVQKVNVQIALDARVGNLVSLNAGAQVSIDRVRLQISGVDAEARLIVRLDKVAHIIDRTMATLDKNPKIITSLLDTVDTAVGTVGNVANTALQPGGVVSQAVGTVGQTLNNLTTPGGVLTQTVNTLGQTVQMTLDTTGRIVNRTLDTTGKLVNEQTVGRLLDLPVINQTTNTAGQAVKQVRDAAGNIIEYTLDNAGNIVNARVLNSGGRQ